MIDVEASPQIRTRCICSSLRAVLREREAELLGLKGPCRVTDCVLHYAHRGPCDIRVAAEVAQ